MRLIIAMVVNAWLTLLLPLRLLRRARAAPKGGYVQIVIDGSVVEVQRRRSIWTRRQSAPSLEALREVVTLCADDPRVAGIIVRIEAFHHGLARASSLREILLGARASKKPVVAHLPHGGGTLACFVASAADRILVGPESDLDVTGFAVIANYLRGALDRAGVEPEVLARGRYKTAGEFLERKSMSGPQREQLGAVLDVAHETLVEALATGRNVAPERAREWIDDAPWSAETALSAGLVDAVLYDDEVPRALDASREKGAPTVPWTRYLSRRTIRFRPFFRRPCIAVVEVNGPIVGQAPLATMPAALMDPILSALRAVRDDPRARGLVLYVNSRGGSALASDRIAREVRRVAEKKPVVAYLGDVAASGGYMVAVAAQSIVAQPSTITGSIGVIAARMVLGPLLTRLGIGTEVVKRGARADMMSPAKRLDDAERAHLERHIEQVYQSFLSAVVSGRNKPLAEIEPLAGGRVHTGRAAHEHGLVDRLGGFDVALGELRTRIGVGAERHRVEHRGPALPRAPGLLSRIIGVRLPATLGSPWADLALLALGEPRARAWLVADVGEIGDG